MTNLLINLKNTLNEIGVNVYYFSGKKKTTEI